jgi:predicted lipoprotein with Yx(FWY)xxD motif
MNPRLGRRQEAFAPVPPRRRAWTGALVAVTSLSLTMVLAPAASAHPAAKGKTAMVVEVVNRAPFGPMLATVRGASLYTTPTSCTGGCLGIWPPLLMPKGKKIPTGVTGLGTAKLAHHRRQVTYMGKRLYTFEADHGGDVTGNGVGGFMVATTH